MSFFERIDRFDGPQRSQLRVVPVGAAPGGECYLLFVGGSTLLVDSGFQFCGPQLVEHLRRTLQGRALDYILLTHSHYDHALGSVFCKQAWPEATVVASRYAAGIFQKPHARALMRRLDAYQAAQCGVTGAPDCIDALRVDLPVEDGDQIPLDGDTIRIIALPGHMKALFPACLCKRRKPSFATTAVRCVLNKDLPSTVTLYPIFVFRSTIF